MTDQLISQNGIHEPLLETNGVSKFSQDHPNPTKIEIQFTTKKKKQVINLQSSSQKMRSRDGNSPKPIDSSVPKQSKKVKMKKIQYKCQLCKGQGKKIELKKCTNCKLYAHLHCIDENEVRGKYICARCKSANQAEQNKVTKKLKKQQEKIEIAKSTQKKIEKEKKKDESNRILQKFKQKYPYYIGEGDKIKFPIEDKLLFIYKDYFQIPQTRITPIEHPLIPSEHLGDLLQIQNFIVSFSNEIEEDYDGQYRKSVLYTLLNCEGTDKTFEKLLGAIVKIYLKDIFEKNKTQNVKILNDNSFFLLLGTINEAQKMTTDYVALTAPQIIRQLSTVPSMKNSFINFSFPQKLDLEAKLNIIATLIQGLSEIDAFHDMVSRKSEKISEMTKDKADLVVKLKKNEAEALSNKEKLKQMIGKVSKMTEGQNQEERDKSIVKQVEKTKKKTQKLANDGEASQRIIKEFKSKIVEIARTIPFVISEVLFLGCDRNGSEYFFYLKEPHRIYVKYRNYVMDENQEFKIYESKEKIVELMKTLNAKGVRQKRLYDSINNLIKQQVLRNQSSEDNLKESITTIEQPVGECCFLVSDAMFRQKLISDVMQIEENFTNYLTIKNYRWASESKREQFRFGFPYIEDIKALREQIRNLQESFLFVEVVREKQVKAEDSESNEEMEKEDYEQSQRQCRRKKPIRIWGINSQRVRKFWIQYLESCQNYIGIWISVNIFKNYVDNYLEKKMEHIRQQQRKENQQREKQLKEKRLKQQKQKQKEERNLDRLRSRDKPKGLIKKKQNKQVTEQQVDNESSYEGIKTRRNLRSNNCPKSKPFTIDSDDEPEQFQQVVDEQSDNDDQCDICKDIGEVICCDTCPKVYHLSCLGLKQTPEGDWSCMDCLHRINNERQTRSKAKKMYK